MTTLFGNAVAGAIEDTAVGVLTDWYGRGDLTRAALRDVVLEADAPEAWLPAVKDAGVQLSRACVHVAGTTYESKVVRKPQMPQDLSDDERADIGERCCETFVGRFRDIEGRIKRFKDLLGPELYAECLNVCADSAMLIDTILAETIAA